MAKGSEEREGGENSQNSEPRPPASTEEKRLIVDELVSKLAQGTLEEKKLAVIDLRLLAKWDMENRQLIAEAGGIPLLVFLLSSVDEKIQENTITALLNLSIHPDNRLQIIETVGALDGILEVLRSGKTAEARENAAATLFSLLIVEEYREIVGQQPGAIASLLDLLREANYRGKKDAIKVLFHLSLHQANKAKVVAVGAVPLLVSFLIHKRAGLTEDALSVLSTLALSSEGVDAIMQGSTLLTLVEILKGGSPKAKENATAVLLSLCQTGGSDVLDKVMHHSHTIVASLCTLLTLGSQRGKLKASLLMKILVVSDPGIPP